MSSKWMPDRVTTRRRRLVGTALAAGVLTLAMGAGAFASTLNQVVPPTGTVAGQGYAYFLQRTYATYYNAPPPGPSACETVTVGGKKVILVENIHGGKVSCHVPAGKPIFVNELGRGCANIPGQHNGYGTSKSALDLCARQVPEKALIVEFLDGRKVTHPNYGQTFWKNAGVFSIKAPAGRFGLKKSKTTNAAAWGWALLLKGLPKGTHTVHCKARYPHGGKIEFLSTVTLHVG